MEGNNSYVTMPAFQFLHNYPPPTFVPHLKEGAGNSWPSKQMICRISHEPKPPQAIVKGAESCRPTTSRGSKVVSPNLRL